MKVFYPLLLLFAVTTQFVAAQPLLNINDNINDYIKKYPTKFALDGPQISNWKEGTVTTLSYQDHFNPSKPMLIKMGEKFLVAVLQADSNENFYYLIDTNGDGELDYKSDELFLPYTIFFYTAYKASENNVLNVYNAYYNILESNTGPVQGNELIREAAMEMERFRHNEHVANRDLAYLLAFSIENSHRLDLSAASIRLMEMHYSNRFENVHPLIIFMKAENMMYSGKGHLAVAALQQLLLLDPTFFPARFHLARLQNNEAELAKLKNQNSNHWLFME